MIEPGDSEKGRHLAARSASRRRKLTLEEVELELGELATLADAQRWLKTAFMWGAAGVIPAGTANACASCVRDWLKAHDSEVDVQRLRQIEERLHELEERRQR